MKQVNRVALAAALAWAVTGSAHVTEGALGRPITGMQITPFSGLIPPDPGLQLSFGYLSYRGEIGGSREVPIAGDVSLGLEADINLFTLTGVYIWPTAPGKWNYASMLTVPHISNDVTATVGSGLGTARIRDDASDFFDLYFAPVIASYHVSEMEHWSFAAYVYAPTADYDPGRVANPGLNVWTVSPTVGYTRLFLKGGVELSASAALDWYSENDDTNYQNGLVARLEGLAMLRGPKGWGVGAVAGWIEQVEDDSGPIADRLDGFRGRSFGVGPMLTYSKRWDTGEHLDFSLRYVKEFSVENRFEGDPLLFTAALGF